MSSPLERTGSRLAVPNAPDLVAAILLSDNPPIVDFTRNRWALHRWFYKQSKLSELKGLFERVGVDFDTSRQLYPFSRALEEALQLLVFGELIYATFSERGCEIYRVSRYHRIKPRRRIAQVFTPQELAALSGLAKSLREETRKLEQGREWRSSR